MLSSTHSCRSTTNCHPSHQRRIVSSTSFRPARSQSVEQRCSRMAHRRRKLSSSSSEFLTSPPSLGQGYELLHPPTEGLIQNLATTFPYPTVSQKTTPALSLPAFESQTVSLRVAYLGRDRSPPLWRVGPSHFASHGAHRLTQRRHLPPSAGLIGVLIRRRGFRSESL